MNTPTPTPTHSSSTATTVTLLSTDETLAAENGLSDRAALPSADANDTPKTEGGPPGLLPPARVMLEAPARSAGETTQRSVSRRTRHLRKVRVILAELLRLEPEEIEADSDLSADLGADSLDLAELVMALEEEFETSMTDAEAEDIQTVEDILSWLDDNVED